MMRITPVALLLVLTGCVTFRKAPVRPFEDAVRASLEVTNNGQTYVVITMKKNGDLAIDGRPTSLGELSNMNTVQGIPSHPLSAIIRADREASRENIRACLNALTNGGVMQILVANPKNKDMHK